MYPQKADAENDVNRLGYSTANCVAAEGVLNHDFYVKVSMGGLPGGALRTAVPYDIKVTSDCAAPFFSAFPQLTGPPEVSVTSVAAGGTLDVTLPVTTNVESIQVWLRHANPQLTGSHAQNIVDTLGTTSASATLTTHSWALPGDCWVAVRLRARPSGNLGTTYAEELTLSATTYQAVSALFDADDNWIGDVEYDSGIAIARVTITE